MGKVPGVGPQKPQKPPEEIKPPASKLKPGKGDDKIPNKWSEAIKKFPALLDAVLKGMAMKIMKDSKKHAAKRQKNK